MKITTSKLVFDPRHREPEVHIPILRVEVDGRQWALAFRVMPMTFINSEPTFIRPTLADLRRCLGAPYHDRILFLASSEGSNAGGATSIRDDEFQLTDGMTFYSAYENPF